MSIETPISPQLKADLRLAARLRSLGRLYGGLAHDLKAPLNAMVLNLELLKASLSDDAPAKLRSPERQREWVAVLSSELERLRRSLDELLVEISPENDEIEVFDARQLLREVATLLAPQCRQQGVELELETAEDLLMLRRQPGQLRQALIHVAVNALDALPEGGRLRLSATRHQGDAVLLVEDTGPGIPDEVEPEIFDLHRTTKPNRTGTGLFVTRSLLAAQGGSVRVLSTGSEGTTLELRLPLEDEE